MHEIYYNSSIFIGYDVSTGQITLSTPSPGETVSDEWSEKTYLKDDGTFNFSNPVVEYTGGESVNGEYGVETAVSIDALTGSSTFTFADKTLNVTSDIKATFDQVTGLNNATGKMFRLYNAAFKCLPDASG